MTAIYGSYESVKWNTKKGISIVSFTVLEGVAKSQSVVFNIKPHRSLSLELVVCFSKMDPLQKNNIATKQQLAINIRQ